MQRLPTGAGDAESILSWTRKSAEPVAEKTGACFRLKIRDLSESTRSRRPFFPRLVPRSSALQTRYSLDHLHLEKASRGRATGTGCTVAGATMTGLRVASATRRL